MRERGWVCVRERESETRVEGGKESPEGAYRGKGISERETGRRKEREMVHLCE